MATTSTHPGVSIQELTSDVHPIMGVATGICAFVGYTATGIDNSPQQIFSFSDYTRIFGGLASNSEVSYAVQQFFANGGAQAWVVRTPMTGAVAAAIRFNSMTFTALSSGSWANGVLLVDIDFIAVADSSSFNLTFTNTLDGTVESFPNVTTNNMMSNYYVNIVNAPDHGSQLVSVVDNAPGSNVLPVATDPAGTTISPDNQTLHYALGTPSSYDNTTSIAGTDGTGLPTTMGLIGAPTVPPTGLYALESVDLFNLLCIPEATRAMAGDPGALDPAVDPNAIYSAALTVCDLKRAMLLIDCPPNVNTVAAAVDWKTSGLTVSDPNGAAFFPRLRLPDPLNSYTLRTFAPSGVVAGLYARNDASRGVWKAPSGIDATLIGVQQLVYPLTDAEQAVLNPLGLNCFRNFPVYGSVLWGSRTLAGADADASQWKYVPVRRVALFLESSLWQGTQWVVFEPNAEPLWSAIRLSIGTFLQSLFLQGYFQGTSPAQAYFVKCDNETTTQTDIDNGVVNIVVGFAPLEPAEFVVLQIQQMSGQMAS